MGEQGVPGHRAAGDQQSATLRSVAELLARVAPPEEVLSALAAEAGQLRDVDYVVVCRYMQDGSMAVLGSWAKPGANNPFRPGARREFRDTNVIGRVFLTRGPARIDHYDENPPHGSMGADLGVRSSVGVPIILEGSLWGVIAVGSTRDASMPADTEAWLSGFTELVSSAISNAQARVVLRGFADEQAALRRVATLVASGVEPAAVFAAVAKEVASLFSADITAIVKFEPGQEVMVVGGQGLTRFAVGGRYKHDPRVQLAAVRATGKPTRFDPGDPGWAALPEELRAEGARSMVGAPIVVEDRLWGGIYVASRGDVLSRATEHRLAGFTELVAAAIANATAQMELRGFAEEQAALRRVAELVARAAPPGELFGAVAAEAGSLLDVDFTVLARYAPDGSALVVGSWSKTEPDRAPAVGRRTRPGGSNMHTLVFQTGRSARIDSYDDSSGHAADVARGAGIRSGVAAPIYVEDRLWGILSAASMSEELLPAHTEARLAGFTELLGTAVANAEARVELRAFADEQAALRRVAELVARAAPPDEVFAAVTEQVGRVLDVDFSVLARYDPDGACWILGAWSKTTPPRPVEEAIGIRVAAGGRNIHALVFESGLPERIDDYAGASGQGADVARAWEFGSAVGVPIYVEDRLWGVSCAASRQANALPSDIERRMVGFTKLVGTAVANTAARAELNASRARIVAAADMTRRRIERDLHDGAQQRLISVALQLRAAQASLPPDDDELIEQLDSAVGRLTLVTDELREIARGIHPAVLAEGGLRPALRGLARGSAIPVELDCRVDGRLPEQVELAAYYVVAEGLTNAVKHADASVVQVDVAVEDDALCVRVSDDGRGGADAERGSGLVGLADRVQSLGGIIVMESPRGAGTKLDIVLPIEVSIT